MYVNQNRKLLFQFDNDSIFNRHCIANLMLRAQMTGGIESKLGFNVELFSASNTNNFPIKEKGTVVRPSMSTVGPRLLAFDKYGDLLTSYELSMHVPVLIGNDGLAHPTTETIPEPLVFASFKDIHLVDHLAVIVENQEPQILRDSNGVLIRPYKLSCNESTFSDTELATRVCTPSSKYFTVVNDKKGTVQMLKMQTSYIVTEYSSGHFDVGCKFSFFGSGGQDYRNPTHQGCFNSGSYARTKIYGYLSDAGDGAGRTPPTKPYNLTQDFQSFAPTNELPYGKFKSEISYLNSSKSRAEVKINIGGIGTATGVLNCGEVAYR